MDVEYQSWKASQARAWAESVRNSCARLEQRQLALDELMERYDGLAAVAYRDMPGKATMEHGDDRIAELVIELDILRDEMAGAIIECRYDASEFMRTLMRLDGVYDALLTARYIRGLEWQQVADEMNYTVGYVRDDLATAALSALYDVMPHKYKDAIPKAL